MDGGSIQIPTLQGLLLSDAVPACMAGNEGTESCDAAEGGYTSVRVSGLVDDLNRGLQVLRFTASTAPNGKPTNATVVAGVLQEGGAVGEEAASSASITVVVQSSYRPPSVSLRHGAYADGSPTVSASVSPGSARAVSVSLSALCGKLQLPRVQEAELQSGVDL